MTAGAAVSRAELRIRQAAIKARMGGGRRAYEGAVRKIIKAFCTVSMVPGLAGLCAAQLRRYAVQVWHTSSGMAAGLTALTALTDSGTAPMTTGTSDAPPEPSPPAARLYGVPYQAEYARVYREQIRPTIDRLMTEVARDPGDVSGRNSLRARAEMETRYWHNMHQVDALVDSGTRLVVCSTHTGCSERCRPWQGRVYSLDGTGGKTPDGRAFVPLEKATNVYYTTRAGVTYKNGLLGFNCRHYLVPYGKDVNFPTYTEAEEDERYKLEQAQRGKERAIRRLRVNAALHEDVAPRMAAALWREVRAEMRALRAFCHKHELIFSEERTLF